MSRGQNGSTRPMWWGILFVLGFTVAVTLKYNLEPLGTEGPSVALYSAAR
jgi:hypothetical protein